ASPGDGAVAAARGGEGLGGLPLAEGAVRGDAGDLDVGEGGGARVAADDVEVIGVGDGGVARAGARHGARSGEFADAGGRAAAQDAIGGEADRALVVAAVEEGGAVAEGDLEGARDRR